MICRLDTMCVKRILLKLSICIFMMQSESVRQMQNHRFELKGRNPFPANFPPKPSTWQTQWYSPFIWAQSVPFIFLRCANGYTRTKRKSVLNKLKKRLSKTFRTSTCHPQLTIIHVIDLKRTKDAWNYSTSRPNMSNHKHIWKYKICKPHLLSFFLFLFILFCRDRRTKQI